MEHVLRAEGEEYTDRKGAYKSPELRVRVSSKCLTFEVVRGAYRTKLTFRKGSDGADDRLRFAVEETRPVTERKTCNLGHTHEEQKPDRVTEYARLSLDWRHAEQLMEWFSTGTWREVRQRRKDEVDNG